MEVKQRYPITKDSAVITSQQLDGAVLTNQRDVNNAIVDSLQKKVNSGDTYTKEQIDEMLSNIDFPDIPEIDTTELKQWVEQNTLSSVTDDVANGVIQFKKGANFGDFLELGDIIQGAKIDQYGFGSFSGLKSPYMQIYELIYNRKTAVQGEFAFSDGDTVDGVTQNDDQTYTLVLRQQYEGYVTSFKKNDIVYANVNVIGNSGESATSGKCWMRVNGVSYDGLSLNVSLYSDRQVPSGKNIEPQPYMVITRHGNETDKSRQGVWVISSEDGRMYMLTGVDSPIINNVTAYATVWGKLPQNLVDYIQQHVTNFNPNQPYLYARGAVIQDLILFNYKGEIIKTENYRGAWSYKTAVNDPYVTTETTYDTVTHNGSKWVVQASGTIVEPSETVTEWTIVTAKGETGVSYSLKPSPSTVQVFEDQSKSVLSLDVTVVESGEKITQLTEQDELDERGLKVQFALDGKGDRYDLEIGGVYAIEDESSEAVFVDETYDGEDDILYFEGEAIDLNQVQDNITVYLVKDGVDIAEQRVPVVKDGITPFVSFKSMVFIRSNGTPDKPTDGDYENPVPTGWSDGIPAGTEPIWSTSRVFSTDPNFISEWDEPQLFADTPDIKMVYSSDEEYYTIPDGFDASDEWYESAALQGWNKLPDEKTIWMAVSRFTASAWSEWEVIKVKGEKGDPGSTGQTSFKSFVFLRSDEEPSTPEGGSYDSPLPSPLNGWSDGTPNGTERLWMSTRIFSSDGLYPQQDVWTKPEPLADSTDFDVEYSSVENPSFPTGHPNTNPEWSNISDTTTIWMATSKKSNGEWSDWQVQKIKGEKGDKGSGIAVKGAFATLDELKAKYPNGPENDGDCYVVGNYLYAWNGSEWINIGQIAGENGINGKDSVRIDLDNENDSMLYDSDGNLLSGAVTSDISLYEGDKEIVADFTIIGSANVNASIEGDTLTVTGCTAASGYVKVGCIYKEQLYAAKMTIKRIVNGVKYEIEANPNVVTYNETKDELSNETVTVEIYKSAQDATGNFVREKLSTLPIGHLVAVLPSTGGSITVDYNSGATVTVDKSWEYFTVLLVDDYENARLDEETVPVIRVKDGDNGENGHTYQLRLSHNVLSVLVDATSGKTVSESKFVVDAIYEIDNVAQEANNEDNVQLSWDGGSVNASYGVVGGVLKCVIQVLAGIEPTTKNITISVTPKGFPTAYATLSLSYPQRGLVGPAGDAGIMLYPAGYWDANTVYTQVKDEEGKAVATPFVYYQNQQGAGDYYVLQRDLPNAGIDPSTDDSQTYWKRFQKIQYLFTEALMANWARLAKSVFWGDYMFSSKGVNQAGEVVDHTAYMGTDNPMFDSETNRLTGALIPNLFLDLENGLIKTNKLSETFRDFRSTYKNIEGDEGKAFADILNLGTSYNIKCNSGQRLLLMPLLSNINGSSVTVQAKPEEVDGVHSVITMLPNLDYESKVSGNLFTIGNGGKPATTDYAWPTVTKHCMLVCSDPRIFSRHSYRDDLYGYADTLKYAPKGVAYNHSAYFPNDGDMFFSVNGTLTKWLLLEAGTTANLRLVKDANSNHIWIVENAGDFEQLDVKVQMGINGTGWVTGGVIGMGSYNGNDELQDLGINRTGRFYGSKRLRTLYDYSKASGIITIEIEENPTIENRTTPISIANEIVLVD